MIDKESLKLSIRNALTETTEDSYEGYSERNYVPSEYDLNPEEIDLTAGTSRPSDSMDVDHVDIKYPEKREKEFEQAVWAISKFLGGPQNAEIVRIGKSRGTTTERIKFNVPQNSSGISKILDMHTLSYSF